MESKRAKLDEKEDRISALPDSIIHHILSFLPTTKEAVRTGILSKRWQYQWTRVAVLLLYDGGNSPENFLKFIEHTLMLHECLKIKKFHLDYRGAWGPQFAGKKHHGARDPQFSGKIRFATRRHVEELQLTSPESLPIFLFNHASLVKLKTQGCTFMPNGMVNWRCLTQLEIRECKLTDQAIQHILSGSPSLKSLDLWEGRFNNLVIASKSLKKMYLSDIHFSTIDISCPSLEKLILGNMCALDGPHLVAQLIENVVSGNPLLESFELGDWGVSSLKLSKLVIASKFLKSLALTGVIEFGGLEISCPKLEKLKLSGSMTFQTVKLVTYPSSLCATIDLFYPHKHNEFDIHMIKSLLVSLQYVKQLKLGHWFIKRLSDIAIKEGHLGFVPRLNIKCLILSSYGLNDFHRGIACILDHSNALEELIIKVEKYNQELDYDEKLNEFGESFWSSNTTMFNCLTSHLKTIKIIGFPFTDHNRKLVLNFVQFLLNNARVLEKMVVQLKDKDYETSLILNAKVRDTTSISQELLSMSRYSQSAKFELLSS